MQKPIEIIYEEYCKDIETVVNKYVNVLPAFTMTGVLSSLQEQLSNISKKQLVNAQNLYTKAQEEELAKSKESEVETDGNKDN